MLVPRRLAVTVVGLVVVALVALACGDPRHGVLVVNESSHDLVIEIDPQDDNPEDDVRPTYYLAPAGTRGMTVSGPSTIDGRVTIFTSLNCGYIGGGMFTGVGRLRVTVSAEGAIRLEEHVDLSDESESFQNVEPTCVEPN